MFVAAGVAATDDDLSFGDPKMVGKQLNEGLVGSAINRFFSEVDRQLRGIYGVDKYERAAFRAGFDVDEIKHNYDAGDDVGGTSKVSDREGQGRAGV